MKMHEALVVAGVERTAKDMKFRLKLLGTRFRYLKHILNCSSSLTKLSF